MKTIVIATDGSPAARAATDFGLELARRLDSSVVFVHVGARCEPLEEAASSAAARGIVATTELLVGDAADEIVTYADSVDADAIVVGTRRHGPLAGTLIGSVSQRVLRDARLPVLVVPLRQSRTDEA